jgi:hypothetical protein
MNADYPEAQCHHPHSLHYTDLRMQMACEAKSDPHGTANLFRRIPSGVMKSVGKK